MRLLPVALIGLALMGPAAAQAPDVLDGAVHALEMHVVSLGGAPSLHDAVEGAVRPAARLADDPVLGPSSPMAAQAAGPAAPSQVASALAADALLWLLAVGGGATAAGLGWRHLHRRNVLDHPARLGILLLLRRSPGLHLRGIARESGLSVQRAAYHLDTLERLGLVASQDLAGKRCYHEAGVAQEVRRALLEAAQLPGPAARDVLAFIATHPGASQSEVARQLGMFPGSARWHLQRLAAQGTLVEAREGKALTYRPREARLSTGLRP